MNDEELLRYNRQILLPEIDIAGQQQLLRSTVLVIGLGGLGSPASVYLAAAGIGCLRLCDHDRVELSNLQRQIAYGTEDLGRRKVEAMAARLHSVNPQVQVQSRDLHVDSNSLASLLQGVDVVMDGSDNFTTRLAVNAACLHAGVPLVSGAVVRWEGQLGVFDFRRDDAACYACLYGDAEGDDVRCSDNGVIAAMPGVMGSMQALEVLKLLTGVGEVLHNRLLVVDGKSMAFRDIRLRKDPGCPVCGGIEPA